MAYAVAKVTDGDFEIMTFEELARHPVLTHSDVVFVTGQAATTPTARAYDKAAKLHFKQFARLNFP